MFLKAIEIFGFKSFPKKTHISFDDGIIAIVGPNGCGKSNIIDAIRWVLGEKSAKSLRGEHMEDVIFAGSDTLKPMGLAQVTLFINNENNILNGKFSEIEITRKLYRSGESEYYINKKRVLQKDIHNLFLDTGIGKNAYSFIGQGQVEMILSKKFEDRRAIFEEAAGISKYKVKKTETLLNLQKTRENLARLKDILIEIEKVRNNAKVQAEKAERYKKLDKDLKNNEILFYSYEYKKFIEKIEKETSKLETKQQQIKQIENEIENLEKEIREANLKLSRTRDDKVGSEKEILTIENRIVSLSEQKGILEAQIKDLELSIGENKLKIESLQNKKNTVSDKIKEIENDINEKENLIKQAEEKYESLKKKFKEIEKDIIKTTEEIKSSKERIIELTEEIDNSRKKLKDVVDEFVKQIDLRKEEIASQQDQKSNLYSKVVNTIENLENKLSFLLKELESNTIDFEKFKKEIQDLISIVGNLKETNKEFLSLHDGFQEMIFDKKGIHAQKENLEHEIHNMESELVKIQNIISVLEDRRNTLIEDKSLFTNHINESEKNLNTLRIQKENALKEKNHLHFQEKEYAENILSIQKSIEKSSKNIDNLKNQINNLQNDIEKHKEDIKQKQKKLKSFGTNIDDINNKIEKNENKIKRKKIELEELKQKLNSIKLQIREYEIKAEDLKELLFENYSEKIEETSKDAKDNLNINAIQNKIKKLKEAKRNLGTINPMAIEEYKESEERYKFLMSQKRDVEKAEADLLEVLEKVSKESEKIFTSTFNKIRSHYKEVTRKLFRGGRADLILTNPDDPLNSPIEIIVQPPGKKNKNLNMLSGGEKALSAISLVFSIFLSKPSPFCILDEIDAPLDDQNIMRFVSLMKELSKNIQFLIITHNKQTMAAADRIYGVTMEEPAISKVVSLMLDNIDKEKYQIDSYDK